MLFKNLTTRELYASIPNQDFIVSMMEEGIKDDSVQLAVSAMEELIRRRTADEDIERVFTNACNEGNLKPGTSMFSMITSSLMENHKTLIMANLGRAVTNSGFKATDANSERALRILLSLTISKYSDEFLESIKDVPSGKATCAG